MANKKITELPSAGGLSGAELVEAVQGGVNVKTTVQAIANLTLGATAFTDLTDAPVSYTGEAGKVVTVKGDESGLEFTTVGGGTTYTAGPGLSLDVAEFRLGTASGDPTIPDGDTFIEPENAEMSGLSFGELTPFYSLKFFADVMQLGSGDPSTFASIAIYGHDSGGLASSIGVIKSGSIDGAHVTKQGAADGSVANVLNVRRTVAGSGLTTAGAGGKIVFTVSNGTAFDHSPNAGLSYILTDVTNGSEDSKYVLSVLVNGVETTSFEVTGTGIDMGSKKVYGLAAASANGEAVRYEQLAELGYWKTLPGTPVRSSNTVLTITDTSNANLYDLKFNRGTVLKWTDTTTKMAMVVSATYSSNTVTVTIIGDVLASSATMNTFKYTTEKAHIKPFAIAGTMNTGTDLSRKWKADKAYRVLGADGAHGTAGTTNASTYDINKNGTTMFTTKVSIASAAVAGNGYTADDGTSLALDDVVSLDCDSVSTTPPVDLYVDLFVFPSNNVYL